MDYTKTKQDIEREKYDLNNDPVLIYLRNQDETKFNVGDILIKMCPHGDKWLPERASSIGDTPKKYLYAFENELGIGYVKQFKQDGRLADTVYCMTTFDSRYAKFVLDPEYADHIILGEGEDFKPVNSFKEKKKFRDKAIANTKKLLIDKEPGSILAWINQLEIDDEFYCGYNVPDMIDQKYKVVSFVENTVSSSAANYDVERYFKFFGLKRSDTIRILTVEIVKHRYRPTGHKLTLSPIEFINMNSITEKEPFPLVEDKQ
jgi:hypothetical protein